MTGRKAYAHEGFIASTDERFRPVSLYNGPDGALYVVDFHRGALEHRLSVTTVTCGGRSRLASVGAAACTWGGFIASMLLERMRLPRGPRWRNLSAAQLVEKLGSPNGWVPGHGSNVLLVERATTRTSSRALKAQAIHADDPVTQIHTRVDARRAWSQMDKRTLFNLLGQSSNRKSPRDGHPTVRKIFARPAS